jgi:hypothetical protein
MRSQRPLSLLILIFYTLFIGGCAPSSKPESQILTGGVGCGQGCQQTSPNAIPSARIDPSTSSNTILSHFARSQSLENLRIQVWEGRTFVSSTEPEEIHVAIFENATPLKNREPVLRLILPDQSTQVYYFPPTDENGKTDLLLPSIPASTGTLIAYEVCINGVLGDSKCVGENYLIWNY